MTLVEQYEHYLKMYQERYLVKSPETTWQHISFWRTHLHRLFKLMEDKNMICREMFISDMQHIVLVQDGVVIDKIERQKQIKLKPNYVI